MKASATKELLEPFGHAGVDRHGKLFMGVEVVSSLDGKPRDPQNSLDVVLVIDISGSMGSHMRSKNGNHFSKLEAVKGFVVELAEKLEPDDTVSVATFDNRAETLLPPTKISDNAIGKVRDSVALLQPRGGTTVYEGLKRGAELAREAQKIRLTGPKKEGVRQETRVVLLTDMSDGEVRSAEEVIRKETVKMAEEEDIHVTYVGVGEDFEYELTEKITVAEGCNYCCIMEPEDFTKRVASEIGAVFFPTVKNMELVLITKQFKITGIWGAGKDGPLEHEDPTGWNPKNNHLYGESAQISAQKLSESNFPSEIVGVIVDGTESKPLVLAKENSVFPSPSTETPGYQKGGWIIIGLEPQGSKGGARGFVRFETRYTEFGSTCQKTVIKEVDLGEAEHAIKAGKKEWSFSEGID
eukprot:TRINITY_DN3765_c0_g1_i1.p1 TRINITY_DN3765_c0_g1~~TRINITY_DN3765_c0_g1_i1.p1  ORF type:complete len:462 (-),score=97.12 TRINITY_DN3765_c0_g1_i1:70-1302(-)